MGKAYNSLIEKIKKYNGEFTLITKELNRFDDYVEIYHRECGNTVKMKATSFRGKCSACSKNSNHTSRRFDTRMISGEFPDYILKSKFVNQNQKVKILHTVCGNVFEMLPSNFIRGQRCNCLNVHKNKGHEKFLEEFNKLSEGQYELLSEYTNSRGKILVRHNACGSEFLIRANDFIINGHRCPKCFKGRRVTHNEFMNKIPKYICEDFDMLTKYTKRKEKISLKCHECNTEFSVNAEQLIRGCVVCPECKMSSGERQIRTFLEEHHIQFISQKKFPGFKNKNAYYKYDFYLESYNLLIEYDGEQHYLPIFGKTELERVQENDRKKDEFANNNNIKILRIPYFNKSRINEILEDALFNDYPTGGEIPQ